jgi:ribosomal protein L37AE/L43A
MVMDFVNYFDVRQLKGHIKDDAESVKVKTGDKVQVIQFGYQKTGYGQKRFFICPDCSKRVEKLYCTKFSVWKCQRCSGANPYGGIQNNTKGGYDEIGYRMKKYAEKKGIQFEFPFNYFDFTFDSRMKRAKFRQYVKVLQALENMRFHSMFFKVTYKPGIIRQVMSGKHPIMQNVTLYDLKNNVYDWSTGTQIEMTVGVLREITH